MNQYRFRCSETQYMSYYIEAENEEEAREKMNDFDVDPEYEDTSNFSIDEVELYEENTNNTPKILHPTIKK